MLGFTSWKRQWRLPIIRYYVLPKFSSTFDFIKINAPNLEFDRWIHDSASRSLNLLSDPWIKRTCRKQWYGSHFGVFSRSGNVFDSQSHLWAFGCFFFSKSSVPWNFLKVAKVIIFNRTPTWRPIVNSPFDFVCGISSVEFRDLKGRTIHSFTKEISPPDYHNHAHASHQLRPQQIAPAIPKVNAPPRLGSRTSSVASLPSGNPSGRYGGSLDRRRRRLRNRNERDQRARSQSDLLFCDRERNIPPHYCSLQQFQYANTSAPQYASNLYINSCNNNTEVLFLSSLFPWRFHF